MREDGFITEREEEKAEKALLNLFYSPLPSVIEEDPERTHPLLVEDPEISVEEIKNKVFTAKQ